MDDARIIELYFARDEEAIEQTRVCYGGKLYAVAMRILEDREDAQECENDTYLKTWNSIPPNRPVHFLAYIVKICRNAALGMLEYRNAAKRSAQVVELTDEMQQCIPDALAEQAFEPEEIGHLLSAFLREQSEDNRKIFVRRYVSTPSRSMTPPGSLERSGITGCRPSSLSIQFPMPIRTTPPQVFIKAITSLAILQRSSDDVCP